MSSSAGTRNSNNNSKWCDVSSSLPLLSQTCPKTYEDWPNGGCPECKAAPNYVVENEIRQNYTKEVTTKQCENVTQQRRQ